MLRINDRHATRLIAEVAGLDLEAKVYSIAHYNTKDLLTAGVIVTGDNGYSCEIHDAVFTGRGTNRELYWAIFTYLFRVRKIKKVFGRVREDNYKARKFNKHVGFKEETIIDDVFPGGCGMVVMSMYEDDCKFANMKPVKVEFPPIEKTDIALINEYKLPE